MTGWLADRVGPGGSVTALDIRTTYLTEVAARPEVTVLEANLLDEALGDGVFDLIHERLALVWVPNEQRPHVIEKLLRALRPGGWYVSVEAGAPSHREPLDPAHPGAAAFEEVWDRINHTLTRSGITDCFWGRRVASELRARGMAELYAEASTPIFQGGSPLARFWQLTVEPACRMLVEEGVMSAAEQDRFLAMFDDATFFSSAIPQYATRCRRT